MSAEEGNRRLGLTIVNFLRNELTIPDLSLEARDNIEVAIECLQSIYNLEVYNGNIQRRSLLDIFMQVSNPVSIKDRLRAESLKEEGNRKMENGQYLEAEQDYSLAIELDKFNAIFYCNRAGVRIKLQKYFEATSDCRQALNLNPDYAKAYGRMGQAYALVENHRTSARCFRQALELEPGNETYRNFLSVAEQQVAEDPALALMNMFVQGVLSTLLGAGAIDSDSDSDDGEMSGSSTLVDSESRAEESESGNSSYSTRNHNSSNTSSQGDQTSDTDDSEGSSDSEETLIFMRFVFLIREEEGTDQVSGDSRISTEHTDSLSDDEAAPREPVEELNYSIALYPSSTPVNKDAQKQSEAQKGETEEIMDPFKDADFNEVVSNCDNPSDQARTLNEIQENEDTQKQSEAQGRETNEISGYFVDADSNDVVSNSDDKSSVQARTLNETPANEDIQKQSEAERCGTEDISGSFDDADSNKVVSNSDNPSDQARTLNEIPENEDKQKQSEAQRRETKEISDTFEDADSNSENNPSDQARTLNEPDENMDSRKQSEAQRYKTEEISDSFEDTDSNGVVSNSEDKSSDQARQLNEPDENKDSRKQSEAERYETEEISDFFEDTDSNGVVSNNEDKLSDKLLGGSKDEGVLVKSEEQTPSQELQSKSTGKKKLSPVFRLSEISNFFRNFRKSTTKIGTDKRSDSDETKNANPRKPSEYERFETEKISDSFEDAVYNGEVSNSDENLSGQAKQTSN